MLMRKVGKVIVKLSKSEMRHREGGEREGREGGRREERE
jgi:hypothetical protein